MSGLSLTLPPALQQRREQARQYWKARAPRERRALTLLAVLLAVAFVWMLFVQPAWRTLREVMWPAVLSLL